MKNKFGGSWTENKIEIVIKYAKAYLKIMNKRSFKTIYFDGFAGSGEIKQSKRDYAIEGVAKQILSIDDPCSFDIYYLVEKNESKAKQLKRTLDTLFPDKKLNTFVVKEDCNQKLIGLSEYLRENKSYRALAFIDPYGMQLNWKSIAVFEGLGIDMWLLIPSGIGVNRILTKTGEIKESWIKRLILFLGLTEEEIRKAFYTQKKDWTLFGEESIIEKDNNCINKIIEIYSNRLKSVWKYVSIPYILRNSKGSIMFHLLLASQNENARKIASSIIKKMNNS